MFLDVKKTVDDVDKIRNIAHIALMHLYWVLAILGKAWTVDVSSESLILNICFIIWYELFISDLQNIFGSVFIKFY